MPRPIRILELRSALAAGGGPEKTILLGAARTDPSRFRVTVCYLRDARDDRFAIGPRASELGVDYVEVLERGSFDPRIWPALRRIVSDRETDIIHAHEYKTDLLALLLARATHAIPLSTAHGWSGHSARERHVYHPADKRLLSRFPRVIAVSEEIRAELVRHGARPERVTTVLNGIDHRAFRRVREDEAGVRQALGLDPEDVVIGAVGRLGPEKRLDLLLRAVSALRRHRPRLRLLIAGDGNEATSLRRLAAQLELGDSCRFLGHQDDVARLHHAFDIFVQASDHEGTPNAVLEAMALETPIVATAVGGTCQLLEDGVHGLLVPAGDVEAIARAVDAALTDRAAAARRAMAARVRVATDLSFDTRMSRVESVCDELFLLKKAAGAGLPRRAAAGASI
jgi:glycosyltransferase involved in cell wall biosynthesis